MQKGKGCKNCGNLCATYGWKLDEEKYFRCGYALLEYREADKMEYAVRCFSEEDETNMALCWMNPYLAQNFEKAYQVLYRLALRQVSPIHLEDVLGDMEL